VKLAAEEDRQFALPDGQSDCVMVGTGARQQFRFHGDGGRARRPLGALRQAGGGKLAMAQEIAATDPAFRARKRDVTQPFPAFAPNLSRPPRGDGAGATKAGRVRPTSTASSGRRPGRRGFFFFFAATAIGSTPACSWVPPDIIPAQPASGALKAGLGRSRTRTGQKKKNTPPPHPHDRRRRTTAWLPKPGGHSRGTI